MALTTIQYLAELRQRLLYCVLMVIGCFLVFCFFSQQLYTIVAVPLLKYLPASHGIIAINIIASVFVPIHLAFVAALSLSIPFILYQLWSFVLPALYLQERTMLSVLLTTSTILFYVGMLFAYWVILPLMFGFLIHMAPKGLEIMPDISSYISLVLRLLVIFGLIFEVPIAVIILVWANIVDIAKLKSIRPYVIISSFIIGMLLTPPDVVSQIMVAIPIWSLYELGILLANLYKKIASVRRA